MTLATTAPYRQKNYLGEYATDAAADAAFVSVGWGAAPPNGTFYYNTATANFRFRAGGAWISDASNIWKRSAFPSRIELATVGDAVAFEDGTPTSPSLTWRNSPSTGPYFQVPPASTNWSVAVGGTHVIEAIDTRVTIGSGAGGYAVVTATLVANKSVLQPSYIIAYNSGGGEEAIFGAEATQTLFGSISSHDVQIRRGNLEKVRVKTGDVTFTDKLLAPDTLSYGWTSDTDTAVEHGPYANSIGFKSAGTVVANINNGSVESTIPWYGPAGSGATPAVASTTATNAGLHFPGAGELGLAAVGASRINIGTLLVKFMTGSLSIETLGQGVNIKEGVNARQGIATLVAGTVTVATTAVTASSRIMLTGQNSSGVHGELTISARVAGTSFTITSARPADTRDVAWVINEPA